jgi:hypothetical protein
MNNEIGFLLPLSGGADSASVASIVRVMCELAVSSAYYLDEDNKELRVKSKEIASQIDKFIDPSDINEFEESVASRILLQTEKRVNKSSGVGLKDLTDELCNTLLHRLALLIQYKTILPCDINQAHTCIYHPTNLCYSYR